jgi:hypothetical protein
MNSTLIPETTLEIREQPWRKWPYPLVSWWDMQKFSASSFLAITQTLADLPLGYPSDSPNRLITPEEVQSCDVVFELLKKDCAQIGLELSVRYIGDLFVELSMTASLTLHYFQERCRLLEDVIRLEMDNCLFFQVENIDGKRLYDQMELLGREVTDRFPSVLDDAREAGNCLALGRSTACVFHLMRVMESGVQEFGKALGVTLVDEKCWQNILDEINKAIKALPKGPRSTELSQASAALFSVKVAWRNQVMHPKDKYDEREAAEILQHVKTFMGQLARII